MDFFRQLIHGDGQPLDSIPGSFPESQANSSTQDAEQHGFSSSDTGSSRLVSRTLGILFKVPFFLIYHVLNIALNILTLLKPVHQIANFYKRKQGLLLDHSARCRQLLQILDDESTTSTAGSTLSGYTFGSLYNLETGSMKASIVQSSYTDLLEICTEQCKFAVIYLYDPMLPPSPQHISDIFCTEEFVTMVKKYQSLLWFTDITTSEGLQVANVFKVRQFPFTGLLSLTNMNQISLVCRIEGAVDNQTKIFLETAFAKNFPRLIQFRQEKQSRALNRLIREQQDARYAESLRRDQQADQERLIQERNRQIQEDNRRLEDKWLLWRLKQLKPEPRQGLNACKIAIRTATGERIVRRFEASLPIEEIYAFVKLYECGMLNTVDIDSLDELQPPHHFEYQYKFKLVTMAPRVELDPSIIISSEQAIYPSGSILVESMEG